MLAPKYRERILLAALLLAYVSLGSGYVLRTPLWQAPDEPAHYNYVNQLAHGGGIPVLQPGDYDQAYLESLTASRFPSGRSIETLRYEGHQPPLYYLLGAWFFPFDDLAGQARVLRFLSLALGLGTVVIAYLIGRRLFPGNTPVVFGAVALMALLPEHLALNAAVNNDALAGLLVALILLLSLGLVLPGREPPFGNLRLAAGLGAAMGAALLTKTTAYSALVLPFAATVLALAGQPQPRRQLRAAARWLLVVYAIALALGALWFIRNMSVYGGLDILGLARHDAVVVGQPRSGPWSFALLSQWLTTLFQSFWVQLGWMTVPAEPRYYHLLALLCGMAVSGATAAVVRAVRAPALSPATRGVILLGVLLLLVLGQIIYYNLQFYQPQGRYLFPALIPIALGLSLGITHLLTPRFAWAGVAGLCLGLGALNIYALRTLLPLLAP